MRIVLDMQGAQSESRFRGIGRYTLSFALAIVRNRGEHEIILALSGLLPDSIRDIRDAFDSLLPQENIRVWYAPGPVCALDSQNRTRRKNAELIREAFLTSLRPDIIHVLSLFEGYVDDAVSSIGLFDQNTAVSATVFDLIPLLNPDKYLDSDLVYANYYSNKLEHLQKTQLLASISKFSKQEAKKHLTEFNGKLVNCCLAADEIFKPTSYKDADINNFKRHFGIKNRYVLYTGGADERKNLSKLIEAYALLPYHIRCEHQLVFAGRIPDGNKQSLLKQATKHGLSNNELVFTGYVSDEQLCQFYNECALFVFPSLHEGFGLPALEAMSCGSAVIAANTSSLPEVVDLDDALFNPLDVTDIKNKLEKGLCNDVFREKLKEHAHIQSKKFSWESSASTLVAAWENLLQSQNLKNYKQNLAQNPHIENNLDNLFLSLNRKSLTDKQERLNLAHFLARTFPSTHRKKQVLVDISELVQRDAKSGVQRVVKSILRVWLNNPPEGYCIKPVYATQNKPGYFYANRFQQQFLGQYGVDAQDFPVEAWTGDTFIMLDLQHHVLQAQEGTLQGCRNDGVIVKTVIYDLLPILLPDVFLKGTQVLHEQWLKLTTHFDGVICISESVAREYQSWIKENQITTSKSFSIDWFHLGANITHDLASYGFPENADKILGEIQSHTSFLMVGTIEPRKGHAQTLKAFEQLWQEGLDYKLIIVGKQGWLVESFIETLQQHPLLGSKLFWLEGISDEFLEKIYTEASCLIAASYGEGFGLPLIEAAQHEIPIIARNIPVFREVAGEYAFYFENAKDSLVISTAIKEWIALYHEGKHPKSINMPYMSWDESGEWLFRNLYKHHK